MEAYSNNRHICFNTYLQGARAYSTDKQAGVMPDGVQSGRALVEGKKYRSTHSYSSAQGHETKSRVYLAKYITKLVKLV